ncbi:MAG: flagellar biosynthetic protein FliO [bacterium]
MRIRPLLSILLLTFMLCAGLGGDDGQCETFSHKKAQTQAQSTSSQQSQEVTSESLSWFLLKASGFIVILLIILYVLLRSSKHLLYGGGASGTCCNIQIKGSRLLGPKKSLFFVEALGHILILGVTEKQISVLLDIPEDQLSDEQRSQWNQNGSSEPHFKKLMTNFFKK